MDLDEGAGVAVRGLFAAGRFPRHRHPRLFLDEFALLVRHRRIVVGDAVCRARLQPAQGVGAEREVDGKVVVELVESRLVVDRLDARDPAYGAAVAAEADELAAQQVVAQPQQDIEPALGDEAADGGENSAAGKARVLVVLGLDAGGELRGGHRGSPRASGTVAGDDQGHPAGQGFAEEGVHVDGLLAREIRRVR